MRRPTATPRPGWTLAAIAVLAACGAGNDAPADADSGSAIATTTPSSDEVRDSTSQVFTADNDADAVSSSVVPSTTNAVATTSTSATPSPTIPNSTATTTSTSTSTTTTTTTTTAASTTIAPVTTTRAPTPPPSPADSPCPPTGARVWEVRPPSDIPTPPLPEGWRTESAGTSVLGKDLTVLVRPVDAPVHTVMVIGGIHGNEPVSPPTVRAMVGVDIPADTEVWLLALLNPDGSAIGTRCNANGADLNRNFSWDWRADDGGPAPFSEPETAAAAALVERVDPDVVVWVHQPLGYVSSIGNTPDSYGQAWANASVVPVRPDVTQHGGGESWTAFVAGRASMLIEVDTYDARPDMVAAHVAGFAALLEVVAPR